MIRPGSIGAGRITVGVATHGHAWSVLPLPRLQFPVNDPQGQVNCFVRWSRRWAAGESAKDKLHDILEDAAANKTATKGSTEQIIGDYYGACMDETRVAEFRVIGPLSNLPEFQKAWSCKADAPMVRPSDKDARCGESALDYQRKVCATFSPVNCVFRSLA